MAVMVVPAAALLAAGGGALPVAADVPVPDGVTITGGDSSVLMVAAPQAVNMANLRKVDPPPDTLPVGRAPESGLQVKTILAARAISAEFPEILTIGGVRPDSLRWHPNGLALDVMIANYGSAEGIALGDQIVAFAMANADRFALQDCIWRDTYYTPDGGAQVGGYGHYDHVHITTKGGGYPTGAEIYTAR
ncbi:hypothetical protein MBRU_17130 [Mycolicibacterium brumae DSM 44177]|nr:hypothetical protein MBRU_17130 [Mycolicibacterium brumae DSM 44177]